MVNCAQIVGELARLYGESPAGVGLDRHGNAVEVLAAAGRVRTLTGSVRALNTAIRANPIGLIAAGAAAAAAALVDYATSARDAADAHQEFNARSGPSVDGRLARLLNPGVGRAVLTHDRRVAGNAPELLLEAVRAGETISADVAQRLRKINERLAEDLVAFDSRLIEAAAGDTATAIAVLTEVLKGAQTALKDANEQLERTQPIGKFAAQNRVDARPAEVNALEAEIAALKAALKTQIDDPAAAGREPVPAAPATTEAGRKAIAQLERQLALTAELSREETARFEIEQGRYAEFAEGEKARILALARELDLMAARAAELESTKRREEEAAERRREALAELEAAGLALAGPYASARAEIEKWLEETLAALEAAAEGHEDYAARVAEAREIAAERLRRVDEEEAAERLRISKRWQDGVIRGLREVIGDFPISSGPTAFAHGGGVIGRDAFPTRMVDPRVFDGAFRYHRGGIVGSEMPIVARSGEGVFTPGQMRSLAPISDTKPTVNVAVNVRNTAPGTRASADMRREPGGDLTLDIMIEKIEGGMARNIGRGQGMAPTLERRYGLNPAAGSLR